VSHNHKIYLWENINPREKNFREIELEYNEGDEDNYTEKSLKIFLLFWFTKN